MYRRDVVQDVNNEKYMSEIREMLRRKFGCVESIITGYCAIQWEPMKAVDVFNDRVKVTYRFLGIFHDNCVIVHPHQIGPSGERYDDASTPVIVEGRYGLLDPVSAAGPEYYYQYDRLEGVPLLDYEAHGNSVCPVLEWGILVQGVHVLPLKKITRPCCAHPIRFDCEISEAGTVIMGAGESIYSADLCDSDPIGAIMGYM